MSDYLEYHIEHLHHAKLAVEIGDKFELYDTDLTKYGFVNLIYFNVKTGEVSTIIDWIDKFPSKQLIVTMPKHVPISTEDATEIVKWLLEQIQEAKREKIGEN